MVNTVKVKVTFLAPRHAYEVASLHISMKIILMLLKIVKGIIINIKVFIISRCAGMEDRFVLGTNELILIQVQVLLSV